jgi:eukaryotic-like serine/threonine-protein kinase
MSTPPVPERIGKYTISAVLGRGSMGTVYKGFDPHIHRPVAIKTIHRELLGDSQAADSIAARFRNEAKAVGRIQHPGVVAIYDFGEDGDVTFIAMEFVDGRTLDDILAVPQMLSEANLLAVMDQLLEALSVAHAQGVWHRDIKPANLIVTKQGQVKLTDFGIARLEDANLTQVSSMIGTPAYMAPEQFTGKGIDHRADLFACGVLLFLLLSGRRPFTGAPAAVMYQILHEEPPLLSQAGGGVAGRAYDHVVARALAKQADARFSSAQEMRDALRAAAACAAEFTTATVIGTVVQEHTHAGLGELVASQRAPVRAEEAMAGVVMREAPGHGQRVDAFALYVSDAGERPASFDSLPHRAEDGPQTMSATSSGASLPPEIRGAVQQLLAHRLGPLAGALVKRAADTAGGSRPAFIMNLLAETPAAERTALCAELEALLYPPQRAGSGR